MEAVNVPENMEISINIVQVFSENRMQLEEKQLRPLTTCKNRIVNNVVINLSETCSLVHVAITSKGVLRK